MGYKVWLGRVHFTVVKSFQLSLMKGPWNQPGDRATCINWSLIPIVSVLDFPVCLVADGNLMFTFVAVDNGNPSLHLDRVFAKNHELYRLTTQCRSKLGWITWRIARMIRGATINSHSTAVCQVHLYFSPAWPFPTCFLPTKRSLNVSG